MNTNWTFNTVTGTFSDQGVAPFRTNTLYMYLTKPGDVYIDIVEVHALASAYHWHERDILALSPVRRQAYLELLGR